MPEKEEEPGKARGKTKSTKTALCVDDIQQRLPKARVCYVSATGASSLENLGYMTRVRALIWSLIDVFVEWSGKGCGSI